MYSEEFKTEIKEEFRQLFREELEKVFAPKPLIRELPVLHECFSEKRSAINF